MQMKKMITLFSLAVFSFGFSFGQSAEEDVPGIDKSPMDMSYYPNNYPVLKIQDKVSEPVISRVIYSRPHLNGRPIVGGLLEYGKLWRLGANEATEIDFYKDVVIGNKKVNKGRYTLYAIPGEKEWTMIINKETDTWGAFIYDEKKDVVRIKVPVNENKQVAEAFSMTFEKTNAGCNLLLLWDKIRVAMPIAFK